MRSALSPALRPLADRLGVWTSALCVVHCLFTPVLLSSSAVLAHFLPAEEHVHRTLALAIASFGALALLMGFRRHRRVRVLAMMASGLGFIFFAAWFGDSLPSHAYEVAITMSGSALMIAAHRTNHTFCKECSCSAPRTSR